MTQASTWHAPICAPTAMWCRPRLVHPATWMAIIKLKSSSACVQLRVGMAPLGTSECHGAVEKGGSATAPKWTQVDGTQVTCGSCHGLPPPAPHPEGTNCASCHPTKWFDVVSQSDESHQWRRGFGSNHRWRLFVVPWFRGEFGATERFVRRYGSDRTGSWGPRQTRGHFDLAP